MVKVPEGILTIAISGLVIWGFGLGGLGAAGIVAVGFLGTLGPGAWVKAARPYNKRDSMIRTLCMTGIFD
jgi:hypothetical protein